MPIRYGEGHHRRKESQNTVIEGGVERSRSRAKTHLYAVEREQGEQNKDSSSRRGRKKHYKSIEYRVCTPQQRQHIYTRASPLASSLWAVSSDPAWPSVCD
jgi:hypothetical protein